MEPVHGTHKTSKFASEDVISKMPENVITNILDRLPIQVAVRTGILSKNWRFKWTMLTQIVFDDNFFEYLREIAKLKKYYGRIIISRLLLHLKGPVTKFVLEIPSNMVLDVEDINHWILFCSKKGVKELTLISSYPSTNLKLPTHLFSCLELKHLKLDDCCFHRTPSFCGFPNLLSLDLNEVTFESDNSGQLIAQCPLLEIVKVWAEDYKEVVKLVEFAKLENLKMLSLSILKFDDLVFTSSSILQFGSRFPKLQELNLNFAHCKYIGEIGAIKMDRNAFPCLKSLSLNYIDLSEGHMLPFAFEMIRGSLNLQTLNIIAVSKKYTLPCLEVDYSTMGQLQLHSVVFKSLEWLANEMCLIKYLLACSPLLKNMVIHGILPWEVYGGVDVKMNLATELLKLHRVSPIAQVDLR